MRVRSHFAPFWHLSDLEAQIVAETGNPLDRHHVGKLMLKGLRSYPEWTIQIDAGVGKSETSTSVLTRSISCAYSMKQRGLGVGDVVVFMAPNHLDQCIPFYAAAYLGIVSAPIDHNLKAEELSRHFNTTQPKLVFCQAEKYEDVTKALESAGVKADVITFGQSEHYTFEEFMKEAADDVDIEGFQATELDPEDALLCLIPTSGTTGMPKTTANTHKNILLGLPYFWMNFTKFPQDIRALVVSTPQWYTGLLHYYSSAIYIYTRIQTSEPFSCEHYTDIFRIYKPNCCHLNPTIFAFLMDYVEFMELDLSFIKAMLFGGSLVTVDLFDKVKGLCPNAVVSKGYGMSESSGAITNTTDYPKNSIGTVIGALEHRLVDPENGKDIEASNVVGELWIRGPMVFKGYYNNPEATKETFSKDGWFMTGDLMYKDDYGYLYYVDRKKLLLKFRNYQISPTEIEDVIRAHPGVLEVVVSSIQDDVANDLPVACIVKRPGVNVTAQEIKDFVKEHLSDSKQLRGGVLFIDSIPMTPSMKFDRKALKKLILTVDLE